MDGCQACDAGVDTTLSNCNFVQRLVYVYYYAGTGYTYYMSDLLFPRFRAVSYIVPYYEFRAWHGGQVEAIVNFGTALMLDIREVYSIYM